MDDISHLDSWYMKTRPLGSTTVSVLDKQQDTLLGTSGEPAVGLVMKLPFTVNKTEVISLGNMLR